MSLLPWHPSTWAHLFDYSKQNRVPQALLITGRRGLGKLELAHEFAHSLLCQHPQDTGLQCGHCDRCLLLKAQTHPDFIQVNPEEPGKSITVGQIRLLNNQLTLKPQFDSSRVVIINPADQMNNAAANAFLKCLEEPTERTTLILVTDNLSRLPATIVSRCQKLTLTPPSKPVVIEWLLQHNSSLLPQQLETLYDLTQGSPLQALDYINKDTLALRNECYKTWLDIANQKKHPIIAAENWHKLAESPLLFWITTWTIDLIKYAYQVNPDKLYNRDFKDSLQPLSQKLNLKGLYDLYDLVLVSRQRISTPINKQSLFEEILIKWHELNQSSSK